MLTGMLYLGELEVPSIYVYTVLLYMVDAEDREANNYWHVGECDVISRSRNARSNSVGEKLGKGEEGKQLLSLQDWARVGVR